MGAVLKVFLLSLLLLCGCTTVEVGQGGHSAFYVGALRLNLPETAGKTQAVEVKSLGIGWDQGPYLGWRSGNWVIADPRDCQLLIVIRTPAHAENAAKVLHALGGQQPCIVNDTGSLPH